MTDKITFRTTGHRLSAKQLTAIEPFLCSGAGRLPPDYRRFLLQYNGGCPEPAHFRWKDKGKPQESEVQALLGLNPGRLDWPGRDCVRALLLHRSGLTKHAIAIALSATHNAGLCFANWYPHPELNGNPRFRKPTLYPFELWGRGRLGLTRGETRAGL